MQHAGGAFARAACTFCQQLLEAGADLHAKDSQHRSALTMLLSIFKPGSRVGKSSPVYHLFRTGAIANVVPLLECLLEAGKRSSPPGATIMIAEMVDFQKRRGAMPKWMFQREISSEVAAVRTKVMELCDGGMQDATWWSHCLTCGKEGENGPPEGCPNDAHAGGAHEVAAGRLLREVYWDF